MLEVNYPMRSGTIRDWADMEILWDHTFKDKLGVPPLDAAAAAVVCVYTHIYILLECIASDLDVRNFILCVLCETANACNIRVAVPWQLRTSRKYDNCCFKHNKNKSELRCGISIWLFYSHLLL